MRTLALAALVVGVASGAAWTPSPDDNVVSEPYTDTNNIRSSLYTVSQINRKEVI